MAYFEFVQLLDRTSFCKAIQFILDSKRIILIRTRPSTLCTPPQVALAWASERGDDVVPIPGNHLIIVTLETQIQHAAVLSHLLISMIYSHQKGS